MDISLAQKNWRGLIKPKALEIERQVSTDTYGKFIAKPLERGFGVTIGNGLRRLLLSSLQGVAITQLRIDGVLHEFSTIDDVSEDVTDIILNLKEVAFKLYVEGPKTLVVEKTGPGEVKASDIQVDETVEVLNPDQVICTLQENGKFRAELTLEYGKGFEPSDNYRKEREEEIPAGVILVDAFYSPIKRVTYTVSHARVGQKTDYDRLDLEVWTDGSIRPEDAVAYSAKILKDQLTTVINFDETLEPELPEPIVETEKLNESLYRTVDELELSVRSANCLQNAGIKFIGELVQKTEAEMLKTKNFGRKSLNEIRDILQEMGLGFGVRVESFDPESYFAMKKKKDNQEPVA